ncbi:MAG: hypothetical protein RL660_2609 [Bacteroidota bacterium]|jgi:iron complex outermembrane receptor protein
MRLIYCGLLCLLTGQVWGQSLSGNVTNLSGQGLDAVISVAGFSTERTDNQGNYRFSKLPSGTYTITASSNNFNPSSVVIELKDGSLATADFVLSPKKVELEMLTVSGSRFKKRAAEEVVSIEVIKPDFVRKASINRLDEALNKLPGVDVVDNQINIRGGSGWSYGAGSRVMVMVDDMPMLTADANDAKWDFLPIENCEQIEVMKGAASALYGSSALNGVVNFRTAFASKKPVTRLQFLSGMYGNPARKEMAWWGKQQPSFHGGYASHSQKFGNLETVFGTAWYSEDSYLQGDATRRIRFNNNLRYKPKGKQNITLGLNTNIQVGKSSTFFLHAADTTFTNLLRPYGGIADSTTTNNKNQGTRFNIDPYVIIRGKHGWTHNIRGRLFFSQNLIPEKQQSSTAYTVYNEYQAIRKVGEEKTGLFRNSNIIYGIASTLGFVTGELYGNHNFRNIAPYAQLEKKINKVWLLGGMRFENNWLSDLGWERKPVFRAGLNYEPRFGTNIRASWGQGYRYASIAERYVNTNFGAASVFPNPQLVSETGWSAETGIKQGIKLGNWLGYADAALFYMRYDNMMEFNFGYNPPPGPPPANQIIYIGFQSRNIGSTQIYGADFTTMMRYDNNKTVHSIIAGYTYMNPTAINPDSIVMSNFSTDEPFLKYRFAHTIKGNWDMQRGKWSFACLNTVNSKMVNIDEVFENNSNTKNNYGGLFNFGTNGLPTTIRQYRQQYNKWRWVCDARVGYAISEQVRISFIVKNVFNTEFYIRPALIAPPRNFTLQLNADL